MASESPRDRAEGEDSLTRVRLTPTLTAMSGLGSAALAGAVAATGTAIGSLFLLVRRSWSEAQQTLMLAGAAGIMLGATFFSLLLPALEQLSSQYGKALGYGATVGALLAGSGLVALLNRILPHEHPIKGAEGPRNPFLSKQALFVLAIAIHNLPEGLSVGVSSGVDLAKGLPLLLGITAQNLPEGFAVAAALVSAGTSRTLAVAIGALTGSAEFLGALVGAAVVAFGAWAVPLSFAFAAGAMLYVISGEVIPETHGKETGNLATWALLTGFVAMMGLDVLFQT